MNDFLKIMIVLSKNLRGQTCMLHSSCIVADPSQIPTSSVPFTSSTFLVLKLVRHPLSHVLEHSPICQSFHSQSTAGTKCIYLVWAEDKYLLAVEVYNVNLYSQFVHIAYQFHTRKIQYYFGVPHTGLQDIPQYCEDSCSAFAHFFLYIDPYILLALLLIHNRSH